MNGGMVFVIVLVAIVTFGKVMINVIRVRHGYPLEDRHGRTIEREGGSGAGETDRKMALLADENANLNTQIAQLKDRIAVLERIATDPAERVAREIEELR